MREPRDILDNEGLTVHQLPNLSDLWWIYVFLPLLRKYLLTPCVGQRIPNGFVRSHLIQGCRGPEAKGM